MASGETSIPRTPALSIPRETLRSKLERFPWWFVAMVSMALATMGVIFSQPSYNQAFVFIRAGIHVTITTTLAAFVISLLIGLMAGLGRISRHVFFSNLSTLYVEIVRGIPMLVLIFFIAFVAVPAVTSALNALGKMLVDAGVTWLAWLTRIENNGVPMQMRAIIALSVTYGAFSAEVFRAGIQSIPKGQMEAARSQGMTYWQAMRYVILPQAIRNVLPALGNDFVSMLKDSSLVSVLAVRDITQVARLYAGQTFRYPEAFTTLAVLYLIMTLILSLGVKALERGLSHGQHR
ncbi:MULTISPECIES: amino acid ABC transporter permease [Anaerolinea]|uniref:amino acid ABC transporter permease n=1 Tax=Anaerolinea TaxID=233189 RepID=UPI0026204930|nr:amino acid ABC transporter permease [Anaerolinea thermophila]